MNIILYRKIIKLIAMSQAIPEDVVWDAFEKLQSIDKLIKLVESNQLQKIIKEFEREKK